MRSQTGSKSGQNVARNGLVKVLFKAFSNRCIFPLRYAIRGSKVGARIRIQEGPVMEVIVIIGILVGGIGVLVGLGEFVMVSKVANAVTILGRISDTLDRIEKQMEEPDIQVISREPK
jgi:hypothetical protein